MHDLALPSAAGPDAGDAESLFGLSLCAGAGGLDLGLALAEPGYRAVGYIERDAFAAAMRGELSRLGSTMPREAA